jgi:predicted NACHT family NTPase
MPLDLVETKLKKQEQTPNNQDESGNRLKTQEVIYPHTQFLGDLLNWRRENKHIAIAGEAGAGKTTFLVTIAEKLKNSQHLPIFISLADLQGQSLKAYINDIWLPLALHERQATEEQKESLFQQFQAGKIWLLLDALDEMQAKSSAEALDKINREIKEVIGQSRVVMTCRLNVWDAYINRLPNFDTFKIGNLSFEQIDSFISQWFTFTGCPENASILQAKLKEANRNRIRDMVRHPLRLALLCQAFYRNPKADLPETKAGLYELFVRYFYEWKPNIVDVDLITQDFSREKLHQALGKLAIKAIDSDAGFRMSRSFAVKEMGSSDLFNLASNVGWLSLIDRNDLDEEVYSFFHATFQEYFAALAINDHSFLLNHIPNNPLEGSYRVFQSKWREVFLLFLGRKDDYLLQQKRLLMNSLIAFQDNCGGFYTEKSRLLAASGTSEFYDFDEFEYIIEEIVKLAFGFWNEEEQIWEEPDINQTIVQLSRINLGYTQREYTLLALHDLLDTVYREHLN